ncbi:cytochrome P450 [Sparassis latifolia]
MSLFPTVSVESTVLLSAIAGLTSHIIFKNYEPNDLYSLVAMLAVVPALPVVWLGQLSTPFALLLSYGVYYGTLLGSIVTYRLSPFHPLSNYSGPLLSKISKLWLVYVTSKGKQYLYVQQLHQKYGPIVRIGPNELSIIDTDLIPYILGSEGMPKGPLWEGREFSSKRDTAVNRDKKGHFIGAHDFAVHAEARKTWNRAFTTAAVKGYEPVIIKRAAQLIDELRQRYAQSEDEQIEVDLARWLSYCIFDWTGDMVYGGGIELMHEGDKQGYYHTMMSGLYLPALTGHIPWCGRALPYFSFVGKHTKALGLFAYKQLTRRLQEGSVTNDLFYHLLDEGKEDGNPSTPFSVIMIYAITATVAASDTSGTALCNIMYCVLSNPDCYAHLKEEVDTTFGAAEPVDAVKLASMEYLNAVINEGLRLFPALPTTLQRAPTPGSGPHRIGPDIVIPEGTAVIVPSYTMQRHPRYFSPDPEKFAPERWLAGKNRPSGGVHNTSAFIPFSTGPMNCVGRPAAILALRMVLVYLVQAFDMRFAEGYRPRQWEEDLGDYFSWQKGSMPVVLTPRF